MQITQNNPYRIVGLLVGATAREQEKQIRKLKQFIEAEQEPQDDFSLPILGKLGRTIESVSDAASKLSLDSDKMYAALFWFYNGSHTDEPAFDAMKAGNVEQAVTIWSKLTAAAEVTQRNASAYSNLSTLYLSGILDGTNNKEQILAQGISLKIKFLESDSIKDFKALTTDETYKTTKKELQLLFLNQVQAEAEKSGVITSNQLLDILAKQVFSAKEDFLKGFVQKPIEQIEKHIEETKAKRKANKANAVSVGNALYEQTSDNLKQLKSILGEANVKYSSISDKVSEEILECGINYFLHYKESKTDPSSASMELFRKAKVLAIGNIAKQRCQENTENLREWINDKPERDKQKQTGDDLQFISSKLERFQNLSNTVSNAKDLIDSCKPKLVSVKNTLGATDDFYLKISSAVVQNAQNMLVTSVNEAQEGLKTPNPFELPEVYTDKQGRFQIKQIKTVSLSELASIINSAYDVTTSMQSMDMVSNLKESFQKNREALGSLRSQINAATNKATPTNSPPKVDSTVDTSTSNDDESLFPEWIKWVLGFLLFTIILKACN